MKISMREIVAELPDVGELIGDRTIESLGDAVSKGPSLLVYAEDEKHFQLARRNSHVACTVTTPELSRQSEPGSCLLVTSTPRKSFFTIHNHLATRTRFYWRDFPSEISDATVIHPTAHVAPNNVRIGRGTVIEAGARVLEHSIVGEDVILRAGATIGTEGFEFKRLGEEMLRVVHAGGVRIHDRVEIQANTAISRGLLGDFTEIGEDTKLDNLVHVAHGARIGKRCLIAASATISGSVVIGDDAWIGPAAVISDHLTVGAGARITIGAVVVTDVEPKQCVSGNFAIDHMKFKRNMVRQR